VTNESINMINFTALVQKPDHVNSAGAKSSKNAREKTTINTLTQGTDPSTQKN